MDENIQTLKEWIDGSDNIVFFGGAGVSTESGIKDFRSVDGLYHEKYDYPPETILSHTFFMRKTEDFYKFYRDKLLLEGIKPNKAHERLALLEQRGKLKAVITQNIDGLHQKAGSHKVWEIHGSTLNNYCSRCGKTYPSDYIFNTSGLPICGCGGLIRPDVTMYGEALPEDAWTQAIRLIKQADCLIVGGTSLSVYPAANLVTYFKGKHLVMINRDQTPYDYKADLVIHDSIGKVFGEIEKSL
jgi:NAD-dependent deacetylase